MKMPNFETGIAFLGRSTVLNGDMTITYGTLIIDDGTIVIEKRE